MEKPEYGNWVPARMLFLLAFCIVLSLTLLVISIACSWSWIFILVGALATAGFTAFFCYMYAFHQKFSLKKGRLMNVIHEYVKSKLPWDGKGKLLDVGCGAGALTIRCAKAFPESECVGIDYWGASWDYNKNMCDKNARAEGVADRCTFAKGDANHLDFADETFDAVVSNFVYHEVRNNADKESLIRETLRVLKPGGSFSLQDLFGQKSIYGDFDATVARLKDEGIVSEINYIKNTEKEMNVPSWMAIQGMLADIGIIYGKK